MVFFLCVFSLVNCVWSRDACAFSCPTNWVNDFTGFSCTASRFNDQQRVLIESGWSISVFNINYDERTKSRYVVRRSD